MGTRERAAMPAFFSLKGNQTMSTIRPDESNNVAMNLHFAKAIVGYHQDDLRGRSHIRVNSHVFNTATFEHVATALKRSKFPIRKMGDDIAALVELDP